MRDHLDKRFLGWLGHLARMPTTRWPHKLLYSYISNPRTVGAPPKTYGKQIREALMRKKVNISNWKILALDRNAWRVMINTPTVLNKKQLGQKPEIGQSVRGPSDSDMEGEISRQIQNAAAP